VPDLTRPTWIGSDRALARLVARPVARFLHVEAAGGLLLLAATVAALVWANSPWQQSYHDFWATEAVLRVGSFDIAEDLGHWVNDGLMAVFFFVVGLEIKRELVVGDLSDRRDALLPAVAALGGMVVPALIYAAINVGESGSHGWGVPMATDIAFAVGVLALLGDRVPASAKVLLLALAIVDDIGAIVVIAVVYSDALALNWLAAAIVGLAAMLALRRLRVWYLPIYIVLGIGVWLCTFESGVHATIAGVAIGLITPARPLLSEPEAEGIADRLSSDTSVTAEEVRQISFELRESVSLAERIEDLLHPWSSYVIVPIFALANAGVALSWSGLADAAGSAVSIGVVAGLVIGKPVGIVLAVSLLVRSGRGRLPDDLAWRHVVGLGALAGIGFTVSLFISGLAYDSPADATDAALGVLAASVLAAVAGTLLLRARPADVHP
jgi:Na+:H+ antiporter, NhaA family